MRFLFGLTLLFCGCQLLPHKESLCAIDPRCEPVVPNPFALGQPDGKSNSFTSGINTPIGVSISDTGALFVVDQGRWRIMGWKTFPTVDNQPPDFALFAKSTSVDAHVSSVNVGLEMAYPVQVSASGGRLIATNDPLTGANNYAYFYSPPPTMAGASTFSWSVLSSGTATARNFRLGGPLLAGGRLYMVDAGNHRLLIWNSIPSSGTVTDAMGVFGQMDFTANLPNGIAGGSTSARTLNAPQGVPASDGTRLLVADTGNHRALIWNALPTGTGGSADLALGQADVMGGSANQGQAMPSDSSLNAPTAVAAATNRTAVADTGNHRVLLWNQAISGPGQKADVVLGQPSFASAQVMKTTASTMNGPRGVATDGTRLVVSDTGNHRILIWNSWPTQNGQPAELILGQRTPTGNAAGGQVPSEADFVTPVSVARAGKQYFVVDEGASRVLVYSAPPTSPVDRPSIVLGQPDLVSGQRNNPNPSAASLNNPRGASSDGNILAVADTGNHRVLIWRSLPTRNQQPADVILGQGLGASIDPNSGTPQRGLKTPVGVHVADGKIYVADSGNNRVLIWNSIPTQHQAMADVVLGQDSLTSVGANRGGSKPSAQTLYTPSAVFTDGNAIYVSDSDANRVLVYSTLEPTTGQAADLVLGQDSFDAGMAGSVSEKSLSRPLGLSIYRSKLYVCDSGNHRVVLYDLPSLRTGALAVTIIGQSTPSLMNPNDGGLSTDRLYSPHGVLVSESGVYIADHDNGRVLALPPRP